MRIDFKIKLLNIAVFFLATSICLWSTTWHFLDLIKSSFLLYLSIIFTALIIIIFYFNFRNIKNEVFFFLFFFLFVNCLYFFVGLSEYIVNGYNTSYIIEYFIKQNVSILFSLLFYNYIFNEERLDKFILYTIFAYIIIFSVLIYVYLFIYNATFIGVIIDFDYGKTRANKNTLGIFICLLFPFIFSYIIKKKSYFIGAIFFLLYSIIVIKIDSTTVLLVLLLQILMYFVLHFKKSLLFLSLISLIIFSIYSIFIKKSDDFLIKNFIFNKNNNEIKKFIAFETHRSDLFTSGIKKIKEDFFLGSGTETFRIRDDNNDSLTESHNSYINILASYGIFGLFLYLFFYFFFD